MVADLARSLDPRRTRRGDSIESSPPRPPPAHGAAGRGVERAGPHPGAPLVSKGPTWRVDGPGSWCRPRALAAGRCRRLPLLHGPGCSAGSARRPRPRNLLGAERGAAPGPRSSRACPESIRLEQAVQGPGLAQPPSHIAPVDGLVPLLNRRQSFHQGLYRPLNTPAQPTVSRAIKALTGAISRTLVVLLLTAEEVPEDCDFRGGRHPLPLPGLAQAPRSVVGRARARGDKTLILVRLDGGFMWASDPYPGSMHDVAALDASGLLEGMDPSGWIGDKGYVGRGMITPHKKPPNGELSETAKEANRSVNRIRQVVERTIAHIKSWRILHTPYRRPLETFEQTITAALALYSFKTTPE